MRPFDLSLRHKLPLWGSLLIICTAVAVAGGNMYQTRENLKRNMLTRSEILGRALIRSLMASLLRDDVWHAYETIDAPLREGARQPGFRIEDMLVLDQHDQVFVSTAPKRYPLLEPLDRLGQEFTRLKSRLDHSDGRLVVVDADRILVGIPMVAEGVTLGTLVMVHPAGYYLPSYTRIVHRTAWTTLGVLLILLPLIWFWGRRMAAPLILLTRRMEKLATDLPAPLPPRIYPYADELGRLFRVYDQVSRELAERENLKRHMVHSDRLAALGRLSASIAHEINNPLGGLLTATDTLKRHGYSDPVADRVIPLLERGLHQIQDIVGALLVEAKAQSRPLTRQDVEDVHTLLAQEAKKRRLNWEWVNGVDGEVGLPATLVRQVLINLLLNAIQAAGEEGHVVARTGLETGRLTIRIANDGRTIPPAVMERLYEPFAGGNEEGSGLGLWITYQIVQRLKGNIEAESLEGWTRFEVTLPLGEDAWANVVSV